LPKFPLAWRLNLPREAAQWAGRQPIMVFEWSLTPNSKPFSFPLSLTSIKA